MYIFVYMYISIGEMADADFGYVGGAPGKVDLYVGKDVIKRYVYISVYAYIYV
jgi:4-hydroxy-3-methylbut-2-en-1-yl diphosphate synthase IspG/GcpE